MNSLLDTPTLRLTIAFAYSEIVLTTPVSFDGEKFVLKGFFKNIPTDALWYGSGLRRPRRIITRYTGFAMDKLNNLFLCEALALFNGETIPLKEYVIEDHKTDYTLYFDLVM